MIGTKGLSDGSRQNLSRYTGAIECGDEFNELTAGLLVDIEELDTHTGEQQEAFRLIAGPGYLSFRLMLFPGPIRKGKFHREFRAGCQGLTALDEEPTAADASLPVSCT